MTSEKRPPSSSMPSAGTSEEPPTLDEMLFPSLDRDVELAGLMKSSHPRYPVVSDTKLHRDREVLRQVKQARKDASSSLDREAVRKQMTNVIPKLLTILSDSSSDRAKNQAAKELREWLTFLDGGPGSSKDKDGAGDGHTHYHFHGAPIVDPSGNGPIIQLARSDEGSYGGDGVNE